MNILELEDIFSFQQTDASEAAAYTVQLDSIIHSSMKIRREAQGRESDSFKALFKRRIWSWIIQQNSEVFNNWFSNSYCVSGAELERGSSKLKRMFLIEGKHELNFKEVFLILIFQTRKWIKLQHMQQVQKIGFLSLLRGLIATSIFLPHRSGKLKFLLCR